MNLSFPQIFLFLSQVTSLLALCLSFAPDAAYASADRTIVMIMPRDKQDIEQAFQDQLRRLKAPVRFEVLRYSGKTEDIPSLIGRIRQLRPALIYSYGTQTTLALAGTHDAAPTAHQIRDIPIVFAEVTDPVSSKVLKALDRPDRNLTGVSHVAPLAHQIQAMQRYRPFRRIGYITNPAENNSIVIREALGRLAQRESMTILDAQVPLDVAGLPDPASLPGLIMGLARKGAEVLYVGPSTFLAFTNRDLVTRSAIQAKLPTFCATESIVRVSGCLFGLFSNGANVGRLAASKAHMILFEGRSIETVPTETLRSFTLLVNMPVAKELDLYPPLPMIQIADVVTTSHHSPIQP